MTRRHEPIRRLGGGLLNACLAALCAASAAGCGEASRADTSAGTAPDASAPANDAELADGASITRDTSPAADRIFVSDSGTGIISEEEWKRRTAPVEGEHEVDRHVSYGCPAQRIAQDFRVRPTVGCRPRQGTPTVRDCDVEPYCIRHDQCQDKPFGRCRGSPSARCEYPIERSTCTTPSDCTALPNGSCAPVTGQLYCYPTGRCEWPERRCGYRVEECASDADCTTLPGGTCLKLIGSVRCEYQGCMVDADCGQGMRCACAAYRYGNVCVPADCSTDADCDAGQACLLEYGCHGAAVAYHCSTALDTCRTKEDCGTDFCVFKGSWLCEPKFCPVGP